MEEPTFWSLYHEHLPKAVVRELMVHNDGTPRRECPACHEKMEIAWIDLLQLDRCAGGHGVWFDAGELQRALRNEVGHESLAAIEAVGEKRRRRREQQEKIGKYDPD